MSGILLPFKTKIATESASLIDYEEHIDKRVDIGASAKYKIFESDIFPNITFHGIFTEKESSKHAIDIFRNKLEDKINDSWLIMYKGNTASDIPEYEVLEDVSVKKRIISINPFIHHVSPTILSDGHFEVSEAQTAYFFNLKNKNVRDNEILKYITKNIKIISKFDELILNTISNLDNDTKLGTSQLNYFSDLFNRIKELSNYHSQKSIKTYIKDSKTKNVLICAPEEYENTFFIKEKPFIEKKYQRGNTTLIDLAFNYFCNQNNIFKIQRAYGYCNNNPLKIEVVNKKIKKTK